MRPTTRTLPSALALWTLAACGGTSPDADAGAVELDAGAVEVDGGASEVDGGASDAGTALPPDAAPPGDCATPETTVATGDVSGSWCGVVHVTGAVRVPAGETLRIAPGTVVDVTNAAAITVEGMLSIDGTAAARVMLGPSADRWSGLVVTGTLEAAFTDVAQADVGVATRAGGTTHFVDGRIRACGTPASVQGDATFDRSDLVGGTTVSIAGSGAALRMTDTVLDLERPIGGPDCTGFNGGTTTLDHVRITGCHCPLHFNSTSAPVTVTNSIFDGATNPVMIANTSGAFHGNVFDGVGNGMLDIGGGIDVDVADNDWTQPTADIGSRDLSQFRNATSVLSSRPTDVGPRR